MKEHAADLAAKHSRLKCYTVYETSTAGDDCDMTGYIDASWLSSVAPLQSDFYFCGPVPFMQAIYQALQEMDIPEANIHYEFFGPAGSLNTPGPSPNSNPSTIPG
ncbi:Flavohemoprotein [compost metagenome]